MHCSAHGGGKARASRAAHLAPFAWGGVGRGGAGLEVMFVACGLRAAGKAVVSGLGSG